MDYFKYIFKTIKAYYVLILVLLLTVGMIVVTPYIDSEESTGPNDYCNLTEVDYTAIVEDNSDHKANVEITEYLTFDVHASSKSNLFKEVWRELPEQNVDGLDVTYEVKSVTQILPDGTEVPYKETKKMYWEDSDYTKDATKRWHHSDASGKEPDNDESLLIYIPWTYREKLKFKIVYSMNNASLKYKDCSELYLSMYSGKSIKKLESFKAQILIPNELMPEDYNAYTYGTSNDNLSFKESDKKNKGYHTFSINLDKKDLKFNNNNQYIEFCLLAFGEDKHSFTKNAPNNRYSNQNVLEECINENEYYVTKNQYYKKLKSYIFIGSIAGSIIIVFLTMKKYNNLKSKCTIYKPEVEYEFFRDIPSDLDPIFASDLVYMFDPLNDNLEKEEEYAAILLSLVRKKYVEISNTDENKDKWKSNKTLITLKPVQGSYNTPDEKAEAVYETTNTETGEKLEPLTTSERLYYELLEKYARINNNQILLSRFEQLVSEDYTNTKTFISDIEKKPAIEAGVQNGYFEQTDYDVYKKKLEKEAKKSILLAWVVLLGAQVISYFTPLELCYGAYFILGLTLIWSHIYFKLNSNKLILFSQFGINEQAKWRGLYNFLNSDTLINTREVYELPLWEKYLIYATAFGISEKVIKAIKLKVNELNVDNSLILNHHSYIHSSSFHSTSKSFGTSIHTSSRSSFSGHGYGGGGRGGGGGGGGH